MGQQHREQKMQERMDEEQARKNKRKRGSSPLARFARSLGIFFLCLVATATISTVLAMASPQPYLFNHASEVNGLRANNCAERYYLGERDTLGLAFSSNFCLLSTLLGPSESYEKELIASSRANETEEQKQERLKSLY